MSGLAKVRPRAPKRDRQKAVLGRLKRGQQAAGQGSIGDPEPHAPPAQASGRLASLAQFGPEPCA
eukprot:1722994-Pyramimonas_sp.AAC.1